MIRRILVPLDPSAYTVAALKYACDIAKAHDAEITGLTILDVPGIEHSIGGIPLGGFYYAEKLGNKMEKEARERIQDLVTQFKEKCEEEGVKHREAETLGAPAEQIVHEATFYDLVIMGLRTYFHFETQDKPGDSLNKVLDHAVMPLLAVPDNYKPIKKVLFAFDGSLPAAHALQDLVHLLDVSTFEILLLTAGDDEEIAKHYLDQAEEYLKAYSIENVKKEWTSQDIIPALEEKYLEWADLVVVGAHSKKGLIDFLTGVLTDHLIKITTKPLFLGQ